MGFSNCISCLLRVAVFITLPGSSEEYYKIFKYSVGIRTFSLKLKVSGLLKEEKRCYICAVLHSYRGQHEVA